jgi:hypothetical protein
MKFKNTAVFNCMMMGVFLVGTTCTQVASAQTAQTQSTAPAATNQPQAVSPRSRRAPLINARANSAAMNQNTMSKPAEERSPIRASYTFEYEGNRIGKPLSEATGPDGTIGSASIGHDARVGYAFEGGQALGVRAVVSQNLLDVNPDGTLNQTFVARDTRIYAQWGKMIETDDLEMTGVVDFVFSTSDASQLKEKIFQVNLKQNWTLKTSLRNWNFNVTTSVSPRWFKNPYDKADYTVAAYPNITVDLAPDWQLQLEGSFDASHDYSANFFDFQNADADYINIGPLITLNANMQINPAIRFYTQNLGIDVATTYFNFTASL